MRKRLHIAENGSAGGGEAGCGLENRIYCERNLAAEHERQGTCHAKRYLEKAYAASVDVVSDTIVVAAATTKLFFIASKKFTVVVNKFL